MLDTNIVSAMMRDPAGPVAQRLRALEAPVCVSVIVAAELRYGALRKQSARLIDAVESVLATLAVEPLSPPVDLVYGHLRAHLERDGEPMGANDLLIAAHALALDRGLVSSDRAFTRVPGLRVENWLS